jgi:hypothetical protein
MSDYGWSDYGWSDYGGGRGTFYSNLVKIEPFWTF